MRLYKRHGVYHVTYQSRGGKQVRRSLKTSEKRIAEQRKAKLELTMISKFYLRGESTQVTFRKQIEQPLKLGQNVRRSNNMRGKRIK